jgi:hypothetical protein
MGAMSYRYIMLDWKDLQGRTPKLIGLICKLQKMSYCNDNARGRIHNTSYYS